MFPDTNVLVSGLMGRGLCRDLLDRLVIDHTIIIGAPVRDELRRILLTKFHVPETLWKALDRKIGEFEQAPASAQIADVAIADPDDVPVVACAMASGADVFVTGDKALLDLRSAGALPIRTPRELWEMLSQGSARA